MKKYIYLLLGLILTGGFFGSSSLYKPMADEDSISYNIGVSLTLLLGLFFLFLFGKALKRDKQKISADRSAVKKHKFRTYLYVQIIFSIAALIFSPIYELVDNLFIDGFATILSLAMVAVLVWVIVLYFKSRREEKYKQFRKYLLIYIIYTIVMQIASGIAGAFHVDLKGFDSPINAIIVITDEIWEVLVLFFAFKVLKDKSLVATEYKPVTLPVSKKPLSGIAGWLAFFIVTVCLTGAFYLITALSLAYNNVLKPFWASGNFFYGSLGLSICYLLLSFIFFYAFYALLKKKNNASLLIKVALILLFLFMLFDIIFSYVIFSQAENPYNNPMYILRTMVYPIIWFIYISSSARFKNTYKQFKDKRFSFVKIFFVIFLAINIFSLVWLGIQDKNNDQVKAQIPSWQVFNSIDNNFTVQFPIPPYHDSDVISVPDFARLLEYDMYGSQDADKNTYLLFTWEYPEDLSYGSNDKDMEASYNALFASDNYELLESNYEKFKGYDSMKHLTRDKESQELVRGRFVIVDKRIYYLGESYLESAFNQYDFDKFIESFRPDIKAEPIPAGGGVERI